MDFFPQKPVLCVIHKVSTSDISEHFKLLGYFDKLTFFSVCSVQCIQCMPSFNVMNYMVLLLFNSTVYVVLLPFSIAVYMVLLQFNVISFIVLLLFNVIVYIAFI